MNLDSIDFLGISKHFSDEEIMAQRTAKEFASKEIMPIIEECFEKNMKNPMRTNPVGFHERFPRRIKFYG